MSPVPVQNLSTKHCLVRHIDRIDTGCQRGHTGHQTIWGVVGRERHVPVREHWIHETESGSGPGDAGTIHVLCRLWGRAHWFRQERQSVLCGCTDVVLQVRVCCNECWNGCCERVATKSFQPFFLLLEIKKFCQFLSLNKMHRVFIEAQMCVLCVGVCWI